jgi:hypothetical protein
MARRSKPCRFCNRTDSEAQNIVAVGMQCRTRINSLPKQLPSHLQHRRGMFHRNPERSAGIRSGQFGEYHANTLTPHRRLRSVGRERRCVDRSIFRLRLPATRRRAVRASLAVEMRPQRCLRRSNFASCRCGIRLQEAAKFVEPAWWAQSQQSFSTHAPTDNRGVSRRLLERYNTSITHVRDTFENMSTKGFDASCGRAADAFLMLPR